MRIADWELPAGVSRGLWEYVNDDAIAAGYDAALAGSPLVRADVAYVECVVAPTDRVADLGCGTGRLAVALAKRGCRVVAIDLSEAMLAQTAVKAREANVDVARVKANLVDLRAFADGAFDAAACLFQTFGMIDGLAARRAMLGHVFRMLRPGGTFVLHAHHRGFLLGTAHGRRLWLRDAIGSWFGRERGSFRMPPHAGIGPMPMRLFVRSELERALTEAGFVVVDTTLLGLDGPLAGRPWPWRVYGFLLTATKPGT